MDLVEGGTLSGAEATKPEVALSARKIPKSGGGSRKNARWRLRRFALLALLYAVFVAVFSIVFFAFEGYADPLSLVGGLVATFAGFCLWFWFLRRASLRKGRNVLIPSTPIPPGAVAPRSGVHFSYVGRTWRISAVTLLIYISLLVTFLVAAIYAGYPPVLQSAIFALAALMAVMMLFALAPFRKRSFTIDDEGLRCSGKLRYNFDLHWRDIAEIDVVEPPEIALIMMPLPPSVYAFVRGDGSILAVVSPQGEFGAGLGDEMERVLLEQTRLHGIRMGTRKGYRGLRRKATRSIRPEVQAK